MASEQRTIRLLDDLAAGRTTRRGFVRRAAALGLSVPALGALGATPRRAGAAAQDQTTLNFLHSIPPETEQFWEETLLPPFYEANPQYTINA